MSQPNSSDMDRYFLPALGALCLIYFGIELAYIARLPFVMDEFQGARVVYRLFDEIPYIDFKPYKTVLGYYFQLPAMWLSGDPWERMILTKQWMALVTALSLFFAGRKLRDHFREVPIFFGTLLLVFMSTFLERSAALRVDMLTSLCGLFSLLMLLDRRWLGAGLMAGLSFLVSQKGVYFILCGGFALTLDWALRQRDRDSFLRCVRFASAAFGVILIYFAFWASLATQNSVVHEVIVRNQHIALEQLYEIRHYWWQTLSRNPLFYGLALAALLQLFWSRIRGEDPSPKKHVLLAYGVALLGLCLWHKQPWPYFFVLLIPTAWVLTILFFDENHSLWTGRRLQAALVLFFGLGILYPASRIPVVMERSSDFQRSTFSVARNLLGEDDSYLAGLEMLHSDRQSPRRLSWLDQTKLARLAGDDARELVQEIQEDPPKLLIVNYRFQSLPGPVLSYLGSNYAPMVGNIMFYAPTLKAADAEVEVSFDGEYIISGPEKANIEIEGQLHAPGETVRLERGPVRYASTSPFRLYLSPGDVELPTDPMLRSKGILFDNVYGY